jgi:alanine racemase
VYSLQKPKSTVLSTYMTSSSKLKVWVEVHRSAVTHNIRVFRKLIGTRVQLWAVVKSNAYGHGLRQFTELVESRVDAVCVDSVIEGMKLREHGFKKPVLVLGPASLGSHDSFKDAAAHNITVTISNFDALQRLAKLKLRPDFHLKIDTGMHRQGFVPVDIPRVISFLKRSKLVPTGVYTHFASAKDTNYPTYTDTQFDVFMDVLQELSTAGFTGLVRHAAATGGTLVGKKYHLDAVRVGIGLYGLWPSREFEVQLSDQLTLQPALSWHARVSELKTLSAGDYIGYDLVERVAHRTIVAVIPIGYWHGFDRKLSSVGHVLVRGRRAKVLGRVSMDLISVDVTGIDCKVGDGAVFIGRQRSQEVRAFEMAAASETTHYETITRINPLIVRVVCE